MKKLPIGIQSIEKILGEGRYIYVDKTQFAKQLMDEGSPHYFLSRPRRFGKSLFLNTLEEIFKGNKELFKECQIYHSDHDWQSYPILHFDFARIASGTHKQFILGLKAVLEKMSSHYGICIKGPSIQFQLEVLIENLAKKNQVVVLVDEYDSPIINNLNKLEVAEQNRDLMKDFFGTLKSLDRYLKFTFVTGVSKFSQVSLFSGPNNLTDITMDPKYAGMMGYTEEELKRCFTEHIKSISKRRSCQGKRVLEEEVLLEIRTWYDGYRFSEKELPIYNPYSTLRFLNAQKAESYWYSTATPSFLIDEVKKHPQSIVPLSGISALKSTLLDISKLDKIHLAALMFQTGYLTIQDYNQEEDSYRLGFPNKEVRQAFFNSLLQEFAEVDPLEISRVAREIRRDLENFDLESFVSKMNVHFAKMAYQLFSKASEGFYQAVFFTFLEKSGISTTAEIATNIGRIDLVSNMPNATYVFELKLDKTADIAFNQAEAKKYRERYSHHGKDILVMGINFSSQSRNIGDWKGAVFSPRGKLIEEFLPLLPVITT